MTVGPITMNNRTRVITSLRHEQPDKVPYNIWFNKGMLAKMIEFSGESDFEANVGNCFVDVGRYGRNYKDLGNGAWEDQFGVSWIHTPDGDLGTVSNSIVSPQSINDYKFPDPEACLKETLDPREDFSNADQFFILQLGFSLFERAWTLAGMENVLLAMASDEDFTNKLLDGILEFNLAWIDRAAALPINAVLFGDDWGQQSGLLMGPNLWRKFIKPRFKRMCRAVKDAGKYVFIHSCGKVDELFGDLIECGVDLFNPFQPEVMDVFEMKKEYGRSLSFFGGISVQRTLPLATAAETRGEVKMLLEQIGAGGGYVAAPSHSIPPDAKVRNVAAMIDVLQNQ